MNPFKLFGRNKQRQSSEHKTKTNEAIQNPLTSDDDFSILSPGPFNDPFLSNAWVNIAINILIRNVARADFVLEKEGVELKSGSLFNLFHRPNDFLSRYDLWKETAAWWFVEGEAFWWFGPDYGGGLPRQLYVLNPRKLTLEGEGLGVRNNYAAQNRRWYYNAGSELVPIFSDELVHFKDWSLHGFASCSAVQTRLRPLPCASMRTFPPVGRRGLRHKS
jgi:hypothetical protein